MVCTATPIDLPSLYAKQPSLALHATIMLVYVAALPRLLPDLQCMTWPRFLAYCQSTIITFTKGLKIRGISMARNKGCSGKMRDRHELGHQELRLQAALVFMMILAACCRAKSCVFHVGVSSSARSSHFQVNPSEGSRILFRQGLETLSTVLTHSFDPLVMTETINPSSNHT